MFLLLVALPSAVSRMLLPAFVAALLAGCAASAAAPAWLSANGDSHLRAVDELGIDTCLTALDAPRQGGAGLLDAGRIRLVSWNVRKTSLPNWRRDYRQITRGQDLVLIQEASLRADTVNELPAAPHWSFAPGYATNDAITGVLTLSRVEPLARCNFMTVEPMLRTPKATSITQFGLRGRPETLLVVNVHAVNFSLGLDSYKRQLEQIASVLATHAGPIILSGDLNTWRDGRMRTVEALAAALDLEALDYADDRRSLFFGRPLDHIFVRGLTATAVRSTPVTSSDHNPLSVSLSM